MRRIAPLLALPASVLALAATGCGSSTKPADIPSGGASTSPADTTPAAATTTDTTSTTSSSGKESTPVKTKTTDLSKKPVIPKQPANPPSKLVVQDIVKGKGATATDGKKLTM